MPEVLFLDDADRYSRLRLIHWWDQEKLRAASVMVVGAGAIGNEVLKNLALIGVGNIWVVDCDDIEDSNLTRSILFRRDDCGQSKAVAAGRALKDINPDVRVTPI
jgi:adenylyltransferase/sulfurtransferase